jgi:hypothetical protein
MRKFLNVLCSDAVNRYGERFTVGSLEGTLADNWARGIPSNIGHDTHRVFGWVFPFALYLEPGLAREVGILTLPENSAEMDNLLTAHSTSVSERHSKRCKPHEKALRTALAECLQGKGDFIFAGCASAIEHDLAVRAFPDVFSDCDKDGLVNLRRVLESFQPVGPGIFKSKKGETALYCHQFFRRSLSRLNNFHWAFLEQLLALADCNDVQIRLAFDRDLVGYASSYSQVLEHEYWYGPQFSNDISRLQPGVTMHVSEDIQKEFNGVDKTEFWWKTWGAMNSLEVEEVRSTPSPGAGPDLYGCRYVHARVNVSSGVFEHFDGAIRAYTAGEIEVRKQQKIDRAGKHTQYTKLFRVDGNLELGKWKTLTANYFQDNPLVIEYFSGAESTGQLRPDPSTVPPDEAEDTLCPYSFGLSHGVRLLVSYHPLEKSFEPVERQILMTDSITKSDVVRNVIDYICIDLKKALNRTGCDIEIPSNATLLTCCDLYVNLPVIRHGKNSLPGSLENTVEALRMLLEGIALKGVGHVVSFTLGWQTASKEVWVSIAGAPEECARWLREPKHRLPVSDGELKTWVENNAAWLSKTYPKAEDNPPLWELVQTSGALWFRKRLLPADIECEPQYSEATQALEFKLKIPAKYKKTVDKLIADRVTIAPAFFASENRCSKCGSPYEACTHSRYLDRDVARILSKTDLAFVFWTDKPADRRQRTSCDCPDRGPSGQVGPAGRAEPEVAQGLGQSQESGEEGHDSERDQRDGPAD